MNEKEPKQTNKCGLFKYSCAFPLLNCRYFDFLKR